MNGGESCLLLFFGLMNARWASSMTLMQAHTESQLINSFFLIKFSCVHKQPKICYNWFETFNLHLDVLSHLDRLPLIQYAPQMCEHL